MTRILTMARVVWLEMLRRKDVYVLLILLAFLLFVLLSMNLFGLASATAYVLDVGLLLTWLFSIVLAVVFVARQLPAEEQRGTIFTLLAKPVARSQLLLGKWLGAWLSVTAATAVFYLLLLSVLWLRDARVQGGTLLQAWLLHAAALGVCTALALWCSTRLTSGAAATTSFSLLAASFLVVPRIPALAAHAGPVDGTALLALYHLLPHMALFDLRQRLVHGWGPAAWPVCAGVLAYAACFTAVFLLLAWLAYRGKRFRRETVW